jgi:hypothetical protein
MAMIPIRICSNLMDDGMDDVIDWDEIGIIKRPLYIKDAYFISHFVMV